MDDPVSLLLVGIGGYGRTYIKVLEEADESRPAVCIAGVADPMADKAQDHARLSAKGVPFYDTPEAFYADRIADLAVISSPIHFHCPQTVACLEHGSHVLCEKPVSATIQKAQQMMAARDAAGRFVAIGYQLSFDEGTQALKQDIRKGIFGAPQRMKSAFYWPRDHAYYGRNSWAGRRMSDEGDWVLDSPANNANAHYLHNMLYLLGAETDRSAAPASVCAELYRANAIENFDACCMRVRTEAGVEILFYAAHSVPEQREAGVVLEFEDATIRLTSAHEGVYVATFRDGSERQYPISATQGVSNKLWNAVHAVRTGEKPLCGLEAASMQTLCVNGAQDSMPEVTPFPTEQVRTTTTDSRTITWAEGLAEAMGEAFEKNALFSERGVPWARAGREVDITGYKTFPGGDA